MTTESKALQTATTGTHLAQFGELSVQGVVDRKRKIGEIMKSVMREGHHYGKIPGCGDKPTLFKAGAEILAMTFALAPRFRISKTDLPNGHREYEIVCTLFHIPTGLEVGEGVGSCSTHESKYRWRKGQRVCPECGQPAIIKGKAEFGGGWVCWERKDGCGAKWPVGAAEIESQDPNRQENPDPADQFNTVLKMAKKRAQVDATLTATGASDILTQDLEDLPAGSRDFDTREAMDAEFTDRPERSEPRTVETRIERDPEPPRSNGREESFAAQCMKAKSLRELKSLASKFNALPRGSIERNQAWEAYTSRMKQLGDPQPGASS